MSDVKHWCGLEPTDLERGTKYAELHERHAVGVVLRSPGGDVGARRCRVGKCGTERGCLQRDRLEGGGRKDIAGRGGRPSPISVWVSTNTR